MADFRLTFTTDPPASDYFTIYEELSPGSGPEPSVLCGPNRTRCSVTTSPRSLRLGGLLDGQELTYRFERHDAQGNVTAIATGMVVISGNAVIEATWP
jgi:hypothetical protein